jgi:hypothetical protein
MHALRWLLRLSSPFDALWSGSIERIQPIGWRERSAIA